MDFDPETLEEAIQKAKDTRERLFGDQNFDAEDPHSHWDAGVTIAVRDFMIQATERILQEYDVQAITEDMNCPELVEAELGELFGANNVENQPILEVLFSAMTAAFGITLPITQIAELIRNNAPPELTQMVTQQTMLIFILGYLYGKHKDIVESFDDEEE